ncbi:molybdate transporter family protein [Vreelandella gomseomensis]|uniref:molybdate transporter family protein n=1 Tax=Halomonadaceae TaxID=28256 RepID=UPI003BF4E8BF
MLLYRNGALLSSAYTGTAASGVLIGAVLLLSGATGRINWLARLVPRSVLSGIQ